MIVAPVGVMLFDETPLMTGGVVSGLAAVVNIKSPDVAKLSEASLDFTR